MTVDSLFVCLSNRDSNLGSAQVYSELVYQVRDEMRELFLDEIMPRHEKENRKDPPQKERERRPFSLSVIRISLAVLCFTFLSNLLPIFYKRVNEDRPGRGAWQPVRFCLHDGKAGWPPAALRHSSYITLMDYRQSWSTLKEIKLSKLTKPTGKRLFLTGLDSTYFSNRTSILCMSLP